MDGQWRHDHTAPTVLDNLGNVNNCITVQPPVVGAGGRSGDRKASPGASDAGRRSGEHAASDAAGGAAARTGAQTMDRRRHHSSDPYNLGSRAAAATGGGVAVRGSSSYGQIVPARDELVVHHSASLLLPPQLRLLLPYHRGDTSTMPLSVQMQHVFCQSGGEVAVLAMAHRYKDRSITQFLYKPAGPNGRPRSLGLSQGAGDGGSPSEAVGAMRLSGRPPDALPVQSVLQSVRISGAHRLRDVSGHEYIAYAIESCIALQGMQTTLRVERRYKHFHMLDQLLNQQFGQRVVPQGLPAKRAFGNLQPGFVEERRLALERYLQLCIGVPQIAASSIFCNFVEADTRAQQDFAHVASTTRLLERVSTLQGRLLKYGRRLAAWKRRYFCLCDGALHYYYSVEMSNPFQPLGVIALTEDERPLVTLEPIAECGLDLYFGFALHTKERTWRLAAPSAAERAEWVRALCRAGVQLSSTGAEQPLDVPEPERPPAAGASAEGGLAGSLMKCASKVHLAGGAARSNREWVARHFVLLPAEGVLAYLQHPGDSLSDACGFLPLHCYAGVADAPSPGNDLHAFQLTHTSDEPNRCAPGARGWGGEESAPPPRRPPIPRRSCRIPLVPRPHPPAPVRLTPPTPRLARSAYVLAASSAEEKAAWMAQLAGAIEEAGRQALLRDPELLADAVDRIPGREDHKLLPG